VDIPRPRFEHRRDQQYFETVDRVMEILQNGKGHI
jgi:hypothetical protein